MKSTGVIIFALACIISVKAISKEDEIPKKAIEETLSVHCTPDVYDLSIGWTHEFNRLNPNIKVEVSNMSKSSIVESLKTPGNLAIVSNNFKLSSKDDMDKVIIGRQIIVPIISSQNPFLSDLLQKGISIENLKQFFTSSYLKNPNALLSNNQQIKLNYYTLSDNLINNKVGEFLNTTNFEASGIPVENASALLQKIKSDPNGFGFCMLNDLVDNKSQSFVEGINLLPIDKNNNGNLDYIEQIYKDPNTLLRGVWIGKYPRKLTSNLYAVANYKSASEEQKAFLNWILIEGQKSLNAYGFNELVSNEIQSKLDKINELNFQTEQTSHKYANLKVIALVVGIIIFFGILLDFALFRWNRKVAIRAEEYDKQILYNENTVEAPAGLFFDKSHTWAFMEKNGQVKIGMSNFLPSITGTLTGVVLKNTDETIKKGEVLLSVIQKGKLLNIKAPVSGIIKVSNQRLLHEPFLINFSPYDEGWIYTVEPSNWVREIQFLFAFDKFKDWLKSEYLRLKDFLATVKTTEGSMQTAIVLQEGGEIRKSVLKDLDPKVWEEFQQHFIESF
ncbi:MAG: hypothetical protein JEZ09_10250 [Salinivirgaceae bacterium]|nr:hypothetical protein [Salinivirgaceae bacterium]